MKSVTKGALAMVLAGSVTFSATNALLGDQISKLLTEGNALIRSGELKKEDGISQAEKPMKDGSTKLSQEVPAFQEAFNNKNKSDTATATIQQNAKKISKSDTTDYVSVNETAITTPAVTTKPATSTKAPAASTAPKPTGTNTASATPTPAASTRPVTSAKAPTAPTAPKPTGTNTTNATPNAPKEPVTSTTPPATTGTTTTTTPNRGQEVSQAAKEKAESRQDTKETHGKKM